MKIKKSTKKVTNETDYVKKKKLNIKLKHRKCVKTSKKNYNDMCIFKR